MSVFECKGCNFTTLLRSNYNRHLATEKHKSKEKTAPVVTEILTEVVAEDDTVIKCEYCGKTFAHTQSMYRHMKHRCKKKDDVVKLKKKLEEANQVIKNKEKMYKQHLAQQKKLYEKKIKNLIPMNHTTINNTTNNTVNIQNITLLAYKDTDTSHLTEKDYVFCIKQSNCVKHLIEKIHFNPMKPENRNIYVSNLKDKYMMMYDGKQWLAVHKNKLDEIYTHKEMLMEEWVEEKDPELKERFCRYIEHAERNATRTNFTEDIKLMMYNHE